MSNSDRPAGSTGGPVSVSTHPLEDDLPDKMRVHALAKLLSVSSQEVMAALADLGSEVGSSQASIDRDTVLRVIATLVPSPSEESDLPADAVDADPAETAAAAPRTPFTPLFAAPQPTFLPPASPPARKAAPASEPLDVDTDADVDPDSEDAADFEGDDDSGDGEGTGARRRRRRGRRGRGRGRGADGTGAGDQDDESDAEDRESDDADEAEDQSDDPDSDDGEGSTSTRRRRRRRRRSTSQDDGTEDDPPNTTTHVRSSRSSDSGGARDGGARDGGTRDGGPRDGREENGDGVQGVRGSTRLEAKRQRRRDGRDAGRRRTPILSEAEFLARRESVERSMVVRQAGDRTEIGVLEDDILVEHFVTSSGSASLVGNIYLGRVQNVLPSMEAAFVDIGRGRNAVLYAGEVDWDAAGLAGKSRRIEQALSSGDSVLVQVTKDPIGHKGARLTTQLSLAGRFLVYVPSGGATGISRKLPDTERKRLKDLLKQIVPEDAGVIIRTASEGVSHEALERDVRRLQAQWEVVKAKSEDRKAKAPQLLYEEPDLLLKVVRDHFNEDFAKLVVSGQDAWDILEAYVGHVAPELADRLYRHTGTTDVFTENRIDEQLAKALDRKVWLPSGGTLVIDRTEAMTVIDVNTGKYTGSGGNLEETVTRNNLEAAEEIVRQLRLRDIGGIIVIDFIDMVLESNRELVLRRLTECLGRDRTRHQVSEVTSLGLVQMTRKRVGAGLLEAYSTTCEHCRGRGVIVSSEPVADQLTDAGSGSGGTGRRSRGGKGRSGSGSGSGSGSERGTGRNGTPSEGGSNGESSGSKRRGTNGASQPAPAPEPAAAPELAAAPEAAAEPAPERTVELAAGTETDIATAPSAGPAPAEPAAEPVSVGMSTSVDGEAPEQTRPARRRRRAASRPAGPPSVSSGDDPV